MKNKTDAWRYMVTAKHVSKERRNEREMEIRKEGELLKGKKRERKMREEESSVMIGDKGEDKVD